MNDSELLAVLIVAVAESHCVGVVSNRIANEALRRHVAGAKGAALDLGELAQTLREADRRRNLELVPEEQIQREYAKLAQQRAELRKLARPSLTLVGEVH